MRALQWEHEGELGGPVGWFGGRGLFGVSEVSLAELGGLWGFWGGSMGAWGAPQGPGISVVPPGVFWGCLEHLGGLGGVSGNLGARGWGLSETPPPQALTNHSSLLELARPLAGPRQLLLEVELLAPGPRPPGQPEAPPPGPWDPPPPAGRSLALLRLHLAVGAHPF